MDHARTVDLDALTARDAGLVACRHCAQVWPGDRPRCGRCGARLVSRDRRSISRVWAWWWAGLMAYIPANLWPMLHTRTLFADYDATIIGGAVEVFFSGDYLIASIILLASVGIPVMKFIAIAWLAISVRRGNRSTSNHRRQQLLEVVEFIGRWSMIDVFVVALTAALVQFNVLFSIEPGLAAIAFALSVIFTMLSAQSFDSRMIWDRIEKDAP